MLKRLYQWTMNLSAHPYAERWLAFISFIESSLFPIPPDVMLIPMALAERAKALRFAFICTIASVFGAMLGYAIGYFLWDVAGQPIFEFYGYMDEFDRFREGFVEYGAWLILIFGVTFFPFKVITIASGVVALDPVVFILSCLVARSIRFMIEGALIWKFGDPIRDFIEKRLSLVTTVFVILFFGGFIALKFI